MQTRKDKLWIGIGLILWVALVVILIMSMDFSGISEGVDSFFHNIYVTDAGIIEESNYTNFMKNPNSDYFINDLEVGKEYRVIVFLGEYNNSVTRAYKNRSPYIFYNLYCVGTTKNNLACFFNDQFNFESRKEYYNWSYDKPPLEYKHAINYTFTPTEKDIGKNNIYIEFRDDDGLTGKPVTIKYNVISGNLS